MRSRLTRSCRMRSCQTRTGERVLPCQSKILGAVVSGFMILGCSGGAVNSDRPEATALNDPSGSAARTISPVNSPTISVITSPTISMTADNDVVAPLFDFVSDDSLAGWSVVNDTVMGGVSSGQLSLVDGALIFSGELSLDNNGGFASVRSPLIDSSISESSTQSTTQGQDLTWADRAGPRIMVQGDGRTWTVEIRTDDESGGWIATLPTSSATVSDVVIPWTSFEPVTRFLDPRQTDEPLDPSRVVSIAFYLVDGIEGPFRLGIRLIS